MQKWQGRAQSWYRCGRGRCETSPGTDAAGVSPVPVQMWHGVREGARSLEAELQCFVHVPVHALACGASDSVRARACAKARMAHHEPEVHEAES